MPLLPYSKRSIEVRASERSSKPHAHVYLAASEGVKGNGSMNESWNESGEKVRDSTYKNMEDRM